MAVVRSEVEHERKTKEAPVTIQAAISRMDGSARRLLFARVVELDELVDEIRAVAERLERQTEPAGVVRTSAEERDSRGAADIGTHPSPASGDADVLDFAGGIVRFPERL
jgi:hypothetical protein